MQRKNIIDALSRYESGASQTQSENGSGPAMMARRTSPLTHPLIATPRSFNLDPDDYVIFGITPLFASGICETLNNLDIVARGSAWRFAAKHGEPGTAEITGDSVRKPSLGKNPVLSALDISQVGYRPANQ